MDLSYVPDDMDYAKWKTRDAAFSETTFMEPTTREQKRFVLGLRPVSKEKARCPPIPYGLETGLPGSNNRRRKLGLKDQVEQLTEAQGLLMKDLHQVSSDLALGSKSTDQRASLAVNLEHF
jgi:hypothetical protein